jgi:hypothetical protein
MLDEQHTVQKLHDIKNALIKKGKISDEELSVINFIR